MLSRPSVPISGVPFRIGTVDADCFDRGCSDAGEMPLGRSETKATRQKPLQLTRKRHRLHEEDIRLEERCRERARIVHELHDTLLQGFIGASMLLHQAVEQTPADSPSRPALSRALHL